MVILSNPGLAEPVPELAQVRAKVEAAWARNKELRQDAQEVLAEAQIIQQITADAWRQRWSSPVGREVMGREVLQRSVYLRLVARLETMPVIEQAKGIIMAQSHCGDAEAFDRLRQASQRTNVPVRELAAQIVAGAARTATPAAEPDRQGSTTRV